VSRLDAIAFCRWLADKLGAELNGRVIRLPTEQLELPKSGRVLLYEAAAGAALCLQRDACGARLRHRRIGRQVVTASWESIDIQQAEPLLLEGRGVHRHAASKDVGFDLGAWSVEAMAVVFVARHNPWSRAAGNEARAGYTLRAFACAVEFTQIDSFIALASSRRWSGVTRLAGLARRVQPAPEYRLHHQSLRVWPLWLVYRRHGEQVERAACIAREAARAERFDDSGGLL
jgi:hypothetical protein